MSIAKKYAHTNRGLQFLDLIPRRQYRLDEGGRQVRIQAWLQFSTYATWWIRRAITRAIADQARTIQDSGAYDRETINKLIPDLSASGAKAWTRTDAGRDRPADGLPLDKVRKILKIAREPISLETRRRGRRQPSRRLYRGQESRLAVEAAIRYDLQRQINAHWKRSPLGKRRSCTNDLASAKPPIIRWRKWAGF